MKDWLIPAYDVAVDAGKPEGAARMRWTRQAAWDAEHICTESTRFPLDLDAKLRRYCHEAQVTRYHLINYLLRAWMAAWEEYSHDA